MRSVYRTMGDPNAGIKRPLAPSTRVSRNEWKLKRLDLIGSTLAICAK